MKTIIQALIFSCLSVVCLYSHASSHKATGDDGREVLLNSNGTWEYRSNDKLATTEEGVRVRLKPDGRWEPIGNLPVKKDEQVRTSDLDVSLNTVIMEIYRKENTKSTRYDSQTVFYFDLNLSSFGNNINAKLSHFNLFKISDSRGKSYPVLNITPQKEQLKPGDKFQFSVRVDGSPTGLFAIGTKYININIDKSVFNTDSDLKFSKRVDDLESKKMDKPF